MRISNNKGLTLVELMIVMLLSFIVSGLMYSLYKAQQVSSITQTIVAETQQNIRAGVDIMTREIRMAGYDPNESNLFGLTEATSKVFAFTSEVCDEDDPWDGNGPKNSLQSTCGQTEFFRLYVTDGSLRRTNGGSAIATGIEDIEFRYLDGDGNAIAPPGTDATELAKVMSVQISILARAPRSSRDYLNTDLYTTHSGAVWGPYNDNFRRRFARKTIRLRNRSL